MDIFYHYKVEIDSFITGTVTQVKENKLGFTIKLSMIQNYLITRIEQLYVVKRLGPI